MNDRGSALSESAAPDDPFGPQLLALRLAARLTQEELAERSGLSARTISDLERGRRPAPHPVSAHMLANALGLDDARRGRLFASMRQHRRLRAEARDAAIAAAPAPVDEAAILGRETDLAAIEARLAAGDRLLTLAGPGGVGKSRLARALAARRELAGQPVLRVALDAISSPDLVLPAIARASGAPAHGPAPAPARIAAALGDAPRLLVLDNFEHLLAASGGVAALLAAAPALSVLVTSREALRVGGERVLSVPPLALPAPETAAAGLPANPAVALFLRVLADAAPGRTPQPGDPVHAASIVRLLDGLPLAIELAAAQAAVIPLSALAGLLENAGLAALARGRRDASARFATMDAAIAWSADLLPPDARRLFRLLAAFRGGFTGEAVLAVAAEAGDPALVAALPRLAEAHLVEPDPAAPAYRFRMLEPIRLFARDRLRKSGEEEAVRRAHAAWFLRWAREQAREVAGPEPVPALDALDADLANLQAAFAHAEPADALAAASALSQYWEIRARLREGRAVLAGAMAGAGPAADAAPAPAGTALMDAIHWSGYLAYLQSDVPAVEEAVARLRPLAAAGNEPEYAARALLLEVLRRDAAGLPPADSIPLAREAWALVEDGPREVSWHMSAVILANLLVQSGEVEAALPLLRAYAGWARSRGAAAHFNSASDWLGFALLETGAAAEARARFAESIAWSTDAGFTGTVYLPLLGYILATAAAEPTHPDPERAAVLLGALDAALARHGYPPGERNAAALASARSRFAAALGSEVFAARLARGRALALEDALELVTA